MILTLNSRILLWQRFCIVAICFLWTNVFLLFSFCLPPELIVLVGSTLHLGVPQCFLLAFVMSRALRTTPLWSMSSIRCFRSLCTIHLVGAVLLLNFPNKPFRPHLNNLGIPKFLKSVCQLETLIKPLPFCPIMLNVLYLKLLIQIGILKSTCLVRPCGSLVLRWRRPNRHHKLKVSYFVDFVVCRGDFNISSVYPMTFHCMKTVTAILRPCQSRFLNLLIGSPWLPRKLWTLWT